MTSPTPHDDRQLLDLIAGVISDTASDAERLQLASLLRSDAHAREVYRSYINLHVALRTTYGAELAQDATAELAVAQTNGASESFLKQHRWWVGPVLVATVLVATMALLVDWVKPPAAPQSLSLATISKSAGARWGVDREEREVGAAINAGSLHLVEGLAEITLVNNTRVVLEAPVAMRLVSANSAMLTQGRVVAYVPHEARGFTIETPRATVVDLGTEFGVAVGDNGYTEVQVFEGEVIAQWKEEDSDKTVDETLKAGSAFCIDALAQVRGMPFEPERFVRMFPTDVDAGQFAGPLYNRSRYDALHVVPAKQSPTIDGDLADWDKSGKFHAACFPPYHHSHHVDGLMMYDDEFVYIGAHVADPAPLRSVMTPPADFAWRGGSVIVRLAVDPALGWPLKGMGTGERDKNHPLYGTRSEDTSEKIVHMTMWYHRPSERPRLHLSYGLDFHGEIDEPAGWQGTIKVDNDGLGYTLEYAIPWSLLNTADRPPQAGDVLASNWVVHWSDDEGRVCAGISSKSPTSTFSRLNSSAAIRGAKQSSTPQAICRPTPSPPNFPPARRHKSIPTANFFH